MLTLGRFLKNRLLIKAKDPMIYGRLSNGALVFISQSGFFYAEPIAEDETFLNVMHGLREGIEDSMLQHYTNCERGS